MYITPNLAPLSELIYMQVEVCPNNMGQIEVLGKTRNSLKKRVRQKKSSLCRTNQLPFTSLKLRER
jgi:hypothetical protein